MTKNHILIRSTILGLLLFVSSQAHAQVDRALVEYSKRLFPASSVTCAVPDEERNKLFVDFDKSCFVRQSNGNGAEYISNYVCGEDKLTLVVKSKIQTYCLAMQEKLRLQKLAPTTTAIVAGGATGTGGAPATTSKGRGLDYGAGLAAAKDVLSPIYGNDLAKGKDKLARQIGQLTGTGSGGATEGRSEIFTAVKPATVKDPVAAKDSITAAIPESKLPAVKPPVITYTGADKTTVETTIGPEGYTVVKKDSNGLILDSVEKVQPEQLKEQVTKYGADSTTGKMPVDPAVDAARKKLPKETQEAGAQATDGKTETGKDLILTKREEASKIEDTELDAQITKIETEMKTLRPETEATAKCNASSIDPSMAAQCATPTQKAITCLHTNVNEITAVKAKLIEQKTGCSTTSAEADKVCSMVRSEKAQQVQQLMSVGFTVLSKMTAASESCGTTSTLSKVAQGGMLIAQGTCSMQKAACDMTCNSAQKTMALMKTKAQAILSCGLTVLEPIRESGARAEMAANKLSALLEAQLVEGKPVPASIAQCIKHKADIAQMGMAALGFLSAAQDGQKCQDQLTAGGTGGAGSSTSGMANPNMTTAEYCAIPDNAVTITCKCSANPNAAGCVGSAFAAGSGVTLGKVNAGSGASGFASAQQNGLGSLTASDLKKDGSSEPAPGAGLSAAAREALGIGSSASSGGAGNASAGGSGLSSKLGDESKDKAAAKDEKKFGFFSSIGAMLTGGKKPDQAAKAAIRNYEQDEAIKRKVASEKVRAEITTASGKSNFDKIKNAYQSNSNSFEQ